MIAGTFPRGLIFRYQSGLGLPDTSCVSKGMPNSLSAMKLRAAYGHVLSGVVKNWRGVEGSMPTVESYPPLRSVFARHPTDLKGAKAEAAAVTRTKGNNKLNPTIFVCRPMMMRKNEHWNLT